MLSYVYSLFLENILNSLTENYTIQLKFLEVAGEVKALDHICIRVYNDAVYHLH